MGYLYKGKFCSLFLYTQKWKLVSKCAIYYAKLKVRDHSFMTSTRKEVGGLKFVGCLRILLFLNNLFFIFADRLGVGSQNWLFCGRHKCMTPYAKTVPKVRRCINSYLRYKILKSNLSNTSDMIL